MANIVKEVDSDFITEVVHEIIEARGRPVTLLVEHPPELCTLCAGNDPFCAQCDGNKYVSISEPLTMRGLVRWFKEDKRVYKTQGQYFEGDCTLVFVHRDPDVTVSGLEGKGTDYILRHTKVVLVDSKRVVVDSYRREGHPINRSYLICREDETTQDG